MSVTGNFSSIKKSGKGLLVNGNSASPAVDGNVGGVQAQQGELMSRHIALSQGKHVISEHDPDPVVGGWEIPVQGGDVFSDDDPVLAVGIETYFSSESSPAGDKLPSFVSFTWSQSMKIT
jgi:hypothetical protein